MAVITLGRRVGIKGAWNEGKPLRGDRTIMVDGVQWGHVVAVGHGCHGNTYEFYDAEGDGIAFRFANGKLSGHSLESVDGKRRHRGWSKPEDTRSTEQRIIDKARELIDAGRLRSPEVLAAEREESHRLWAAGRDKVAARENMARDAMMSIWRRADLTNAEREGLTIAFEQICGGDLATKTELATKDGISHED